MESSRPVAKKLWHIMRVLYFMIRKGMAPHKLMMDLHLLLKRGKLAGKALADLITFTHHGSSDTFSCLSMDPSTAFYNPREVEFSCTNTPTFPPRRHRSNHHKIGRGHRYDIEVVSKAFEIMMSSQFSDNESTAPSPSPAPAALRSPMFVRPLRVTDSPFPVVEEGVVAGKVDREADEFIRLFYEQLRMQQRTVATPEFKFHRA